MCFKKIWAWLNKPPTETPSGTASKMALLFAINNYPEGVNDLNGCINDQRDVANKLNELFPEFLIKKFTDSEVTVNRFKDEVRFAITNLKSDSVLLVHYSGHGTQAIDTNSRDDKVYDEALYLYDGLLIDDDVSDLLALIPNGAKVIMAFDSCFAGDMEKQPIYASRFYHSLPARAKVGKRLAHKADVNFVAFSASAETELSYDAFIDGEYHGAFTYYFVKTMDAAKTYKQWIAKIKTYLPSDLYKQTPELNGNAEMMTTLTFA